MDLTTLLKLMVKNGASDLFITVGVPPSMKLHGKMVPVIKGRMSPSFVRDLVTGCMDDKQRHEYETTKECNFAIAPEGVGRFRVSAFYQRGAPGMVLRRITTEIPDIDKLNIPPILKEIAMTKRGLVLLVGGTGSGKSTTLAGMIGHRNKNSYGHIITIEDPVEYVHPHQGCIIT
ncbi:MAG: ATPase, T2SS/T4P/T4SS family, partial [Gammaproteobacteria bacterium]